MMKYSNSLKPVATLQTHWFSGLGDLKNDLQNLNTNLTFKSSQPIINHISAISRERIMVLWFQAVPTPVQTLPVQSHEAYDSIGGSMSTYRRQKTGSKKKKKDKSLFLSRAKVHIGCTRLRDPNVRDPGTPFLIPLMCMSSTYGPKQYYLCFIQHNTTLTPIATPAYKQAAN